MRTLDFSVGEYIVGRISGVPALSYSLPVLDTRKKLSSIRIEQPIAVLFASFYLDKYANLVEKANLPAGYSLDITDWKGMRLFRAPKCSESFPARVWPVVF